MDDLIKEFLIESAEGLDRFDKDMVALEKDPASTDLLASAFRTVHTVKGSCSLFEFKKLEAIAHAGENLLSKLRQGELKMNADITDALLTMGDAVRGILDDIETTGKEGDRVFSPLIERLRSLCAATPELAPAPEQARASAQEGMDDLAKEFLIESGEGLDQFDRDMMELEKSPESAELLSSAFRTLHTVKGSCSLFEFKKLEAIAHAGENLLSKLRQGELKMDAATTDALLAAGDAIRRILAAIEQHGEEGPDGHEALVDRLKALAEGKSIEPGSPPSSGKPETSPAPRPEADAGGGKVADTTIRLDVGLLDRLMNLVGELVLTRNRILQLTRGKEEGELLRSTHQLNALTSELQEGVMKTRMQPIGGVFGKFPRLVRSLCSTCGKKASLLLEGGSTELDKSLIEAIRDPLTHAMRNCVDHGIEAPEARAAAGKPETGRIELSARHEGGQVIIGISDDGGGIDTARLKAKAQEKGLLPADRLAKMSPQELTELIFLPGFSTAEAVTNVSGRGVGMDVVKNNIEKIGGSIEIRSELGKGTSFRIKIPLTLAIIPVIIIRSGDARYAISQANLLELVRLDGDKAAAEIETFVKSPVYRLRSRLLPLVDLAKELEAPGWTGRDGASVYIVVLQADDRRFGLLVDQVLDSEEIVVKPLGRLLKGIPVFAGTTVMGDGKVIPILDVFGLAQKAHIITEGPDPSQGLEEEKEEEGETTPMVILKGSDDERMAIPVAAVRRLERFPKSAVEKAGPREVVQYGEEILHLISLSGVLPERRDTPRNPHLKEDELRRDSLEVVVHTEGDRTVGLVVHSVLDIVHERIDAPRAPSREGVRGCIVVEGRVTELLDVPEIMRLEAEGRR